MQLANLATTGGRVTLVQRPAPPDEPTLPYFHKLSRLTLEDIAGQFLAQQEASVFKAYVTMVVNRSATDASVLTELRSTLSREIRGLANLRAEFEGPTSSDDEPAPVDADLPAESRS